MKALLKGICNPPVDNNDIFTRHQLDIGINNILKVKLTPKNDSSVYTQSLCLPINLGEDLTVAHALMQRNLRTTTLSLFKRATQLIEHRNQNSKYRLLVDLLMINEIEFDDYTNNNHPVSTSSDAVQHLLMTSITTRRGSKSRQNTLLGVSYIGKFKKSRFFLRLRCAFERWQRRSLWSTHSRID